MPTSGFQTDEILSTTTRAKHARAQKHACLNVDHEPLLLRLADLTRLQEVRRERQALCLIWHNLIGRTTIWSSGCPAKGKSRAGNDEATERYGTGPGESGEVKYLNGVQIV